MSLPGYTACVGERTLAYTIFVGKTARGHFKDTSVGGNLLLTLRRLMSYIYIYIYMEHPFLMFLDHTQRRSTVGRTPLDE